MRKIHGLVLVLSAMVCGEVLAGNIGNRTNHSAEAIRLGHRATTTDVDAAVYNPAGTTFLEDGWHIGFGNQFIIKSDTLTFQGVDYVANDPVPAYPNISAAYSSGDWALSLHIGVPAGGGSKNFESGHPVFLVYGGRVAALANAQARAGFIEGLMGFGADQATAEAAADDAGDHIAAANLDGTPAVKGSSMYLGFTLSAAYAINDWLSVSAGGRFSVGMLATTGHATYQLELTESGENLAAQAPQLRDPVSIAVNSTAKGMGFSPQVSVHAEPTTGLKIAAQFLFPTVMNFDREYGDCPVDAMSESGTCAKEDGSIDVSRILYESEDDGFALGTFRTDIPAQLSLGASYQLVPELLRVESSFVYYFNRMATWGMDPATGEDKGVLYNDGWDTGLALEFDFNPVLFSVGTTYSKNGATPESLTFLFWGGDALAGATGATWIIDEDMTATVGLTFAKYFSAESPTLGLTYDWWVFDAAVGMTYHF